MVPWTPAGSRFPTTVADGDVTVWPASRESAAWACRGESSTFANRFAPSAAPALSAVVARFSLSERDCDRAPDSSPIAVLVAAPVFFAASSEPPLLNRSASRSRCWVAENAGVPAEVAAAACALTGSEEVASGLADATACAVPSGREPSTPAGFT